MAQHGHHQAAVGLRGNAQVDGLVAGNHPGIVVIPGVDLRKLAQRQHHGAGQKRQQREFAARSAVDFVELLAQLLQLGHVHFFHIAEVRDAALGLLHLLRNLAAQADDGNRFLTVALNILRVAPHHRALASGKGFQVGVGNLPGRAAAMHQAQVHPHV